MKMKKEIVKPKVDFLQVINRRGLSTKTWLEREGFVWQAQVNLWMHENANTYTFSDDFLSQIETFLPEPVVEEKVKPQEVIVEVPVVLEVDEEEDSSKKRKRTNKVQSDIETE